MRTFQALTVATVISVVVLVAIGSLVRTTGSGLGCPDWPLCYGKVLPPLEKTAILEWLHRTFAALVSVLVVLQAAWALLMRRSDPMLAKLGVVAVILLFTQAALGAVTVLMGNAPWTVAVHLAAAFTLLAVVTIMAACASLGPIRAPIATEERRAFTAAMLWTTVATAIILLIGALTVATNAGYGCTTWPDCREAQIPFFSGEALQHIQWLHRFTVAANFGVVIWVFLRVRAMRGGGRMLYRGVHSLIGLFGVQIVVGGLNPLTGFAEWVRISHLAIASAIWVVLILITYAGRFHGQPEEAPAVTRAPGGARGARA